MTDFSISLLIAAHNEQTHIADCLKSIANQTMLPAEVLVGDDGSTDNTFRAAAAFSGIQVFAFAHRGKAATMNALASKARGAVLAFVDADLVLDPRYLERLVSPILAGRVNGTTHGLEGVANPENLWARAYQAFAGLPPETRVQLPEGATSGVFRAIRGSEFNRVGGFSETGFFDDQTLAEKLGYPAYCVAEARCQHFNPESAAEVFAAGKWGGKSIGIKFGRKAIWRFLLPLTLGKAIAASIRRRTATIFLYVLAYDTGVFAGLLHYCLGGSNRGR